MSSRPSVRHSGLLAVRSVCATPRSLGDTQSPTDPCRGNAIVQSLLDTIGAAGLKMNVMTMTNNNPTLTTISLASRIHLVVSLNDGSPDGRVCCGCGTVAAVGAAVAVVVVGLFNAQLRSTPAPVFVPSPTHRAVPPPCRLLDNPDVSMPTTQPPPGRDNPGRAFAESNYGMWWSTLVGCACIIAAVIRSDAHRVVRGTHCRQLGCGFELVHINLKSTCCKFNYNDCSLMSISPWPNKCASLTVTWRNAGQRRARFLS